jgi:hypothetical protein
VGSLVGTCAEAARYGQVRRVLLDRQQGLEEASSDHLVAEEVEAAAFGHHLASSCVPIDQDQAAVLGAEVSEEAVQAGGAHYQGDGTTRREGIPEAAADVLNVETPCYREHSFVLAHVPVVREVAFGAAAYASWAVQNFEN